MKSPLSDKAWFAGGVGLFLVILVTLGYLSQATWWRDDQLTEISEQVASPSSVEPSSSPVVTQQKLIFAVWNGSQVAGQAAKLANTIKTDGYQVVEVKNAPERVSETVVYLASEVELQRETVAKYLRQGTKIEKLESQFPYNILIVIGEQ